MKYSRLSLIFNFILVSWNPFLLLTCFLLVFPQKSASIYIYLYFRVKELEYKKVFTLPETGSCVSTVWYIKRTRARASARNIGGTEKHHLTCTSNWVRWFTWKLRRGTVATRTYAHSRSYKYPRIGVGTPRAPLDRDADGHISIIVKVEQ